MTTLTGCTQPNIVEYAVNNDRDNIKKALDNGIHIDSINSNGTTMLLAAALSGHTELVEFLLENGANPNLTNVQGTTPLYGASLLGFNKIVKILLVNGANPNHNIGNIYGTPLMIAIANEHVEVVELLLSHGVDLTITNSEGKTAIELALSSEQKEAFSKLLSGS